ncbi:transcriptional regulator [Ectobacillus sp. sgz5001026]|uniref:transcriptional regulator n=1 Tax=Ectobacillus sp. sgz5001026 TaxID=3242473 RepID=UPI0036D3B2AD
MSELQIVLLAIILLSQGIFLFVDARKRGLHAWFWGIVGLVQFPFPILIYYILIMRKNKKK